MPSYGSLSFAEQIAFFRRKLNLPTERWDDLLGEGHDRAFVVAGAMQADLLADLRAAVTKAIETGSTLEEFCRDFDTLVEKNGWTGWTGEGSAAGRAWRTKVIYATNLRTSYAAGRYQQLKDMQAERPFWRYRHNDTVLHPRPEHEALDGVILPASDPFWSTAYPPSGFGCRCYVEALSQGAMDRKGFTVSETPQGFTPDKGWDYAPGASVATETQDFVQAKADALPPELARSWMRSMTEGLKTMAFEGLVLYLLRRLLG